MHLFLSSIPQLAQHETEQARKFSGIAHSGKPFVHQGKRCIVDLSALQFAAHIPVLIEHDRQKRAGVAQLAVNADGLSIEGTLLSNEHGSAIAQDADGGFPWQLSAHLQPARIDELKAGQSALVNGQTVTGAISIYRQCLVREVSFTPTGVDTHTQAIVLSQTLNHQEYRMTLEEALQEIANLKTQIQTLTAEKEKLDAEKQKLEEEKAQVAREQDLNAELSARGFQKDEKGEWRGLSGQTKALLLALDKAARDAVLSDLAPKTTPQAAPKSLFEAHPNPHSGASDVKLSDNPLLADAERRAKIPSQFI